MTAGMTDIERWRVAAGFVLLSCEAGWCIYNLALHYVARHLEKRSK
jgi:hypothetical protein